MGCFDFSLQEKKSSDWWLLIGCSGEHSMADITELYGTLLPADYARGVVMCDTALISWLPDSILESDFLINFLLYFVSYTKMARPLI